ncbi:MAG: DegT/DnrJ/EryC1/StrS family aminotransferase, partial [Bacteroidota bacterium]
YTGATPVFADILEDTWQIDPADIKKKITPKTKAIVIVHTYSHPCEMSEINKIAMNGLSNAQVSELAESLKKIKSNLKENTEAL